MSRRSTQQTGARRVTGLAAAILAGVGAVAAVTFSSVGTGVAAAPAAAPAESAWYPAKVGSKWTYKVESGKLLSKAVAEVVKRESVSGMDCAVVETSSDGAVSREHVAVAGEGLARVKFDGEPADPAVVFLKLPPRKGLTWTAKTDVGGRVVTASFKTDEAEVTVPAGKYKTVSVAAEYVLDGIKTESTTWFAEGVGIVQQSFKTADRTVVLTLEKFDGPPAPAPTVPAKK